MRRQPKQKRSQERIERILDVAAEVFDEVGFEAATTHAIASRADTAIGSLYQFFPDKLAIFHALELRHVERVHTVWAKLNQPEIIQLPFEDLSELWQEHSRNFLSSLLVGWSLCSTSHPEPSFKTLMIALPRKPSILWQNCCEGAIQH
jgi:AcrR family transcriptional regulator